MNSVRMHALIFIELIRTPCYIISQRSMENRYKSIKNTSRRQWNGQLTTGIDSRVVHSQHGWWFPEKPGEGPGLFGVWESNINLLLPGNWSGRAGLGYPFKTQMCKVYKA